MSEYMYADIVRGGVTTIASNIFIHVSKLETKEMAEYQGCDPAFTYKMDTKFIQTLPISNETTVQQGDYIIDRQVNDPKTGQKRQYLIISDPQPRMLMMSWQWVATRMRGT